MAREPIDDLLALSLRGDRPARRTSLGLPLPFYHHPVIAISLIMMVASVVQVGVWMVNTRLRGLVPVPLTPSWVTANGLLFDIVHDAVAGLTDEPDLNQPIVFVGCLVISLSSGIAWYAAARMALGPAWGFWTGLCWVAHPSFAFVAPRPSPLTLAFVMVPVVWWALLWWHRSRRRLAALLVGVTLALFLLVTIQGVILLPAIALAMLLAKAGRGRRWLATGLVLVGFAASLAISVPATVPRLVQKVEGTDRYELEQRLTRQLWRALDDRDGSLIAEAAREERKSLVPGTNHTPPWVFFASEFRESPPTVARWYVARVWRTLYDTADGKLRRPLLSLQIAWLIPGLWGYVVALRYGPWRWQAVTAGLFVAVAWLLAALAEPRARNLTQVGGFGIMFALVGVADVYERVFGRRLAAGGVQERTGRSRRRDRSRDG